MTERLDHHGDAEVRGATHLVDLAVNVRVGTPPAWLATVIRDTTGQLAAYPDPSVARAAVAHRHGVPEDMVLPTSGGAEAFTLIARAIAARRPLIVHPQFTEPEAALRRAGRVPDRHVLQAKSGFTLDPAAVDPRADLVLVGNPTNPTGVLHPRATLEALRAPGRVLVVDEAFADAIRGERESLISPDLAGVLVLRSLTKTWGVAGLRAGYVVGDPDLIAALQNHTYRITMQGESTYRSGTLSIEDLSTREIRASQLPFPDYYAHASPLIDGWKLTMGTALQGYIITDNGPPVPSAEARIESSPPIASYLNTNTEFEYGALFFGTKLQWYDYVPVRIVFSSTATQKAYLYLRGGTPNYGCQGYVDVPMRAWDISDSTAPRQLNLAFIEWQGRARANGTWDPGAADDRESLFILGSTYSPTPDPVLMTYKINADAVNMDIQYGGLYWRRTDTTKIPEGATVTILPQIPVTKRDTFLLNPLGLVNSFRPVADAGAFFIGQSYPNPLDLRNGAATATIPLSVRSAGSYTIAVHDVLGRRVTTMFEGLLETGQHAFTFTPPARLPAGMYRIVVTSTTASASVPMVLLR